MKKKTKNEPLKVEVSVGRYSGSSEGLRITIMDLASNIIIATVCLEGDKNMANFFTNRSSNGTAEVTGYPDLLGMVMENKTVSIRLKANAWGDEAANAICDQAEKENPGWEADGYDRKWNSHRLSNEHYSVTIRRWVAPEDATKK